MEVLGKLFGSIAKVKLMRLFLSHPGDLFTTKELTKHSAITSTHARKALTELSSIDLIRKRKKRRAEGKSSSPAWKLNSDFPYLPELQDLLINHVPYSDKELMQSFRAVGALRLLVVSGVFIKEDESRLDLLVVADKVNITKLNKVVRTLESELGRELSFSVFDKTEFDYRRGMNDKLLRDVFDFPHHVLIDKIGLM